jgi:predicted nuclease of predicted toxin-antitoxin system
VRFFLDNDVDVAVGSLLRRQGHVCWSASDAGLSGATDDGIMAYAIRREAAVVSHDDLFAARRIRNTNGQHVWLNCRQIVAVDVLKEHLSEVVRLLDAMADVVVEVKVARVRAHPPRWE